MLRLQKLKESNISILKGKRALQLALGILINNSFQWVSMVKEESMLNKIHKFKIQTKATTLTNMQITTHKTQQLLLTNLLVLSLGNLTVKVCPHGTQGKRGTYSNTIFIIRLLNRLGLNQLKDKEESDNHQQKSKVNQHLFKGTMSLKDIKTISAMRRKPQSGSGALSIWKRYQQESIEDMERPQINNLQAAGINNKKRWLRFGGVELKIQYIH